MSYQAAIHWSSLWLSQCAIAIRQAPAYALTGHSSAHRGLSHGYPWAILGRFAQQRKAMRNRAHARLFIAHALRVAYIGIGCQAQQSSATGDPDGGKRGVESQGRPRVSITKFECSFTRAGQGHPWAIPWLYRSHPWLLRGFAQQEEPVHSNHRAFNSLVRHYPIASLCIRSVVPW